MEWRSKALNELGRRLRFIYHGKKLLRPTWRDMDFQEREPWMRLARHFLPKTTTCGRAFYEALHKDGLPCPYGCKGHAALMYGLVSHLMEKHGLTEKEAWKKARK